MFKRILVLAPHPDDEVLGVGGTIARFSAQGVQVYVGVLTKGYPPHFDPQLVQTGRQEALKAHEILGVTRTFFLDFPAAALDTVPHREVNKSLSELMQEVHPDALFLPFDGDLHLDHQRTFLSALVAARPNQVGAPQAVYAYETLSETNWQAPYIAPNFVPNVFFDISAFLEKKVAAMRAYRSQLKTFPHERSEQAIRALAMLRGSTVGLMAAEAFYLVREVL